MKHLRKLSTLLLALAMIFTMGMSVFADTNVTEDDSINPDKQGVISNGGVLEDGDDSGETDSDGKHTHGTFTAVGNTVTLYKDIVIFNTRAADTVVYLPNIKYDYAVEAVDMTGDEKYITDEYGLKGAVNSGVPGAAPTGTASVEYKNTATTGIKQEGTGDAVVKVTTNKNGVAARGSFDLTFNPSAFTKPGVYRYKVKESVAENAKAQAGITNDTYNDYRYLDVYVQNKEGGGYEIYGFVVFESTDQNTVFTADPDNNIEAKTNGFVSNKYDKQGTSYSTTEKGVDIYRTSNVKISKTITGAMADKNNKFPFKATVKNATITKDPIISYQVVGDGQTLNTTANNPTKTMVANDGAVIGSATATVADGLSLNNEDFVYIYGVPGKNAASNVVAEEYNNTAEVYKVSAKYDNTTDLTVVASTEGTVADMNAKATAQNKDAQDLTFEEDKEENVLAVTNNLNAISPTNVVMRYAPYLFILGGAIMLLVVSRRRKAEQE